MHTYWRSTKTGGYRVNCVSEHNFRPWSADSKSHGTSSDHGYPTGKSYKWFGKGNPRIPAGVELLRAPCLNQSVHHAGAPKCLEEKRIGLMMPKWTQVLIRWNHVRLVRYPIDGAQVCDGQAARTQMNDHRVVVRSRDYGNNQMTDIQGDDLVECAFSHLPLDVR